MFMFIKSTLLVALIFVLTNYFADGHSSGAPAFSCKTMTPGHGAGPQTSPAPYNISIVDSNPKTGIMRIQLTALGSANYFSGFLLRDRLRSTSSNDSPTTGRFIAVPEDSSILDCGNEKASAVTHSSNTQKRSVDVDWQAPPGYTGDVIFVATFVYDYSRFWVGVESIPIQIGSNTLQPGAASYQEINGALLYVYNGCGSTKNCLSYPENCINTKSCDGLVSVSPDSTVFQIEMFAKNSKYVAVGFSDDATMGADSVIECVQESKSVETYRSWNEPNRKINRRLEDKIGLTRVNVLYSDGIVYCKVRVDPVTHILDRKFDLNNEEYFLLLAAGQKTAGSKPGVGYHDVFYTSSKSKRLLSEVAPEPSQDSFYNGCDIIKTCFGVPDGCVKNQNCVAVTSVSVQGQRYIISMQARGAAYVATGFSNDQNMGDDNNVECVNNHTIQAYSSWNVPNRKDNIRTGSNGVELIGGQFNNGVLQCTVAFDPAVNPGFKYDEKYHLLLAAGTALEPEKVGYHNLVKKASSGKVALPSAVKSDNFYRGCDQIKSCFGVPDGCITQQNCKVAVAVIADRGERYVFYLIGQNSPVYIAVGLSEDAIMGDDVVFECVRDEQNGNRVEPYMSWNIGGQKKNKRLRQNYLSLENSSYVDGKLQCAVRLDQSRFNLEGKSFNLVTDKYVLLLASGRSATTATSSSSGGVGYHDIVRQAAAEKRALADVSAIKSASKLLLHLHGSFMIVAWIGFASLGIVLARYYKQTWVDNSCCGKDVWFFWHRFFMFITWILTISGAICIYIYSGGIVQGPGETHALLGFITNLLAFLQPIGALFRPSPDSSRRPIFNWLHWLIGNAAHIFAIVAIFLAVDLGKAELPKWTDWILVGFVAYYVLVHLILSISGCLSDKSGEMRINSIQMKDMNSGRNAPQHYERQKDAQYSGTRKFIFTLHFLIISAFSALLTLLVIYAPVT